MAKDGTERARGELAALLRDLATALREDCDDDVSDVSAIAARIRMAILDAIGSSSQFDPCLLSNVTLSQPIPDRAVSVKAPRLNDAQPDIEAVNVGLTVLQGQCPTDPVAVVEHLRWLGDLNQAMTIFVIIHK